MTHFVVEYWPVVLVAATLVLVGFSALVSGLRIIATRALAYAPVDNSRR